MTLLLTCLTLAMLLPYMAKYPLAKAMRHDGGYDNSEPRTQQSELTGFGARALAAHQNAFESLLIFACAVLAVLATDRVTVVAEIAAMVHIVARIVYHYLYLKDFDKARSLAWLIGMLSSLVILSQVFDF
ncbi:MAPEG family protein [Shewanella sp. NFH-SH190041]|uniref:MAPEG family protein n=1 Tax=Shewanella sp. NFH-SH190041 TaxID=2950245 RepID=UPI0021C2A453|nr:MAPEG family protein [Shewanella sp. NFH-SH190041]